MLINSSSMSRDGMSFFNRLTQKLFLCFFVSLSFFELKADSPKYSAEILNVNFSKNRIDFSVCLSRPFDWRLTPFVSKKTFPGNAPPWLPDPPRTRHRITWGTEGMFEWVQYDFKGLPLRKSFYDMGKMIDDELIVIGEDENPMDDLKNYTKKRRKSESSSKSKKSKSIFRLPKFSKD